MPITSGRPLGYPQLLSSLATNRKFLWLPPPQIWLFAIMAHRTQGNTCLHLPICCIIKNTVKNTDEQSDEEIYRVKSGRVPNTGATVPMELMYITWPLHVVPNLESLQTPILLRFLWKLHYIRQDPWLTQFPALLFLENGGEWDWKFQASNHGLVFLALSGPHHVIRRKDTHHLGNAKGFNNWGQRPILEQKMLLVLLPLRKLQKF